MVNTTRANLLSYYGMSIDLGLCAVGSNLNLISVRGFAKIDQLASISGPDVFDQEENPTGTQRALNRNHSQDAVDYAMGSLTADPQNDARAFPEVILNVRDISVVETYSVQGESKSVSWAEVASLAKHENQVMGIRINLSKLDFPVAPFSPQIARVDGNHRLFAIDQIFAEDDIPETFPKIPFAMHIGLNLDQEMKLFTDINGEHVGMQPAIVDTFKYKLAGDAILDDLKARPLWLAHQMKAEGRPFQDMVGMGGSTAGYRNRFGHVPPLKINALKTAMKIILDSSNTLSPLYKYEPDVQLKLVKNYFEALKIEFPAQWNDKKNYILLQSIGLNAFAMLGAHLIDQAVGQGESEIEFFIPYLAAVRRAVNLGKPNWQGIAGAGGATFVYEKLIEHATHPAAMAAKVAATVKQPGNSISDL